VPGLLAVAQTIVCPCFDVTDGDLERLARQGFGYSETLKRVTGALTGPCQGKYCAGTVLRLLGDLTAALGDERPVRRPSARPPLAPVLLGHLAQLEGPSGDGEPAP